MRLCSTSALHANRLRHEGAAGCCGCVSGFWLWRLTLLEAQVVLGDEYKPLRRDPAEGGFLVDTAGRAALRVDAKDEQDRRGRAQQDRAAVVACKQQRVREPAFTRGE